MSSGLVRKGLLGLRAVAAALMIAGVLVGGARSAAARTGESGVDGNTFTGENHGWSVEWDEDVWTDPSDKSANANDMLSLLSAEGEPGAVATLFAVDGFSGDVDVCADEYGGALVEDRDGVSDVSEATDVDLPRVPRGQTNAAYTYMMDFEDGSSLELIDYVQCRTLVDGDVVLVGWVTTVPDALDSVLANFLPVLDAVEVDEGAGSAESGIDGDAYESPTYGFTLEWDDRVWEVDAEEEVTDAGREHIDRVALQGEASYLQIEARTAFDGDAGDCLEDRIEAMEDDSTLAGAEPLEDRRGRPVEGETDAGGLYVAYVLTFENEDGGEDDAVQYFECRTLEEGESVLIFSLMTYPDDFEDELDAAEEIFETIEV